MHIKEVRCPECGTLLVVDGGLFEIGSVRLRCSNCAHYFLPTGSPGSTTVADVTNASVEITIWEPAEPR
jgi:5-carboxymethyl-2-hydroxymuconate isomerase